MELPSGAEENIRIEFDPGSKHDRLSNIMQGKLTISHQNHTHRDIVKLQGQVCFPNLEIIPPEIEFGCILNDTSKKKYLILKNISEMPVTYEWSFLEEELTNLE
jgi:hydrocephalus-inducing protein